MQKKAKFYFRKHRQNGNVIIKGAIRNGVDEATANRIFDEIWTSEAMHLISHMPQLML